MQQTSIPTDAMIKFHAIRGIIDPDGLKYEPLAFKMAKNILRVS
jgi:hypothetical protein